MSFSLKRSIPLLMALALGAVAVWVWQQPEVGQPAVVSHVDRLAGAKEEWSLSVLGEMPEWESLAAFQETISREEFERLLKEVFTTGDMWKSYIKVDDRGARIRTQADEDFLLRFAPPGEIKPVPRKWRSAGEMPAVQGGKPLDGLRIAIDPGHIGGEWARIEERWLKLGNAAAVQEGDMTLWVAKHLKPRLEKLGAVVFLVREKNEPVTALRPEQLLEVARESAGDAESPEFLLKMAQRLFYRTAEIRARARLVNHTLRPDLVLCLHFNAEAWGSPTEPQLVDRTHLHLLLNGGYTDDEVMLDDQRFAMLRKLLSRTHEEEARVGATVADTFAMLSGLPPFVYPPDSTNAVPVNGHPFLWARNLLANRLYDCPVIFMEPYVMNSTIDYPRLLAGDYDGKREINGKWVRSIFREYAEFLAKGLERHYSVHRGNHG